MTHDTGKISDSWQVIPTIKHRKLQTTCRLLRIGCVARNLNILCKCIFPPCFDELSISINWIRINIPFKMYAYYIYIYHVRIYMNDSWPEYRLRVALQMPSRSLIFGRIGFCMNLAFVAEEQKSQAGLSHTQSIQTVPDRENICWQNTSGIESCTISWFKQENGHARMSSVKGYIHWHA